VEGQSVVKAKKSATALVFYLFFSSLTIIPLYSGNSATSLSSTNLLLNVDGTNASSYSGSGSTWSDLSGAGNHLTIGTGCGDTSGPSWSSSEGGGSFLFNTNKQCVRRATMSSAPQNFSYFFWIKPTALPSSGTFSYLAQIGRDSGQSNYEYMFGFNSSGQLYFWDYAGGYGYSSVTSNIGSTLVTTNVWQYVGFVKDGTNGTFYIGKAGSLDSVGSVTGRDVSYVNSSFVVGYDFRDNNNSYKGYLGAIHYYSGALSTSTIADNYIATPRLNRQSISISSLGTSSKNYPYSQALNISTSGTSGTGAKSYAVTNGTASDCSLSSTSSATPTLSASTSGTCNITATIAADTTYADATSVSATFTFSKAAQSPIMISTTSGRYATNLTLAITGGSTGGMPTYNVSSGNCTISGITLTPTGVGSCVITATLAADTRYLAETSNATTVSIANGVSSASINFNPGTLYFRQASSVSVTTSTAGTVTFKVNGVYLAGCRNMRVNSLNSLTTTCSYKPALHGYVTISATLNPSDPLILGTFSTTGRYLVERRTSQR
jgi:hypothetical protein